MVIHQRIMLSGGAEGTKWDANVKATSVAKISPDSQAFKSKEAASRGLSRFHRPAVQAIVRSGDW